MTETTAGYDASAIIGVNVKTAAVAKPVITAAGVVNAGGLQAGVSPAAWTTIFGQNLSTASLALASSDIANGVLPAALGGVTVKMGDQFAFVEYVSPTQINVQAPDGVGNGAVSVTVTNAGGTSDPVTVVGQPVLPGLFVSNGYVAGVASARPGAAVELYGTGFGATTPAIGAGSVFQGAAAVANPVAVTIGGQLAAVQFSGLVSTGVYQVNATVPNLADGDYPVLVQVAGLATQSGALLKVKS